jgi:hypothetical protein
MPHIGHGLIKQNHPLQRPGEVSGAPNNNKSFERETLATISIFMTRGTPSPSRCPGITQLLGISKLFFSVNEYINIFKVTSLSSASAPHVVAPSNYLIVTLPKTVIHSLVSGIYGSCGAGKLIIVSSV